jgi:hypothetical protein
MWIIHPFNVFLRFLDLMVSIKLAIAISTKNAVLYRLFHFEVSVSAPRDDLGSKFQQILTLARASSIWDFQPLGAKARAMPVDFSDALNVKPVR